MSLRARVLWIGVAIVTGIVVVVVVVMTSVGAGEPSQPSGSDSSATPTPVPVSTPAATAVEGNDAPGADVSSIVGPPVAALTQALADPTAPVELSMIAEGNGLADFQNEVAQAAMNGWRVEGRTEVVSATVVESAPEASPTSMVVDVCLDRSGVTVLDTEGKAVPSAVSPTRVLTRWTMGLLDGSWKVVNRTFTDELDC